MFLPRFALLGRLLQGHGRRHRRPALRLQLEVLEDRTLPSSTVAITAIQGPSTLSTTVPEAVEGILANPSLSATFTDSNAVAPANLTVTINYGDGTAPSSNQGTNKDANLVITQGTGTSDTTYTVTDSHTFAYSPGIMPATTLFVPGILTYTVTLTVTETAMTANTATMTTPAEVMNALSPGDPITAGTPTETKGGDTGDATTAAQALSKFETAIGGSSNTAAAPQTGGYRSITWDGVSIATGSGDTVITPNTVGIPLDSFQGSGVFFNAVNGVDNDAVSDDGFADVNANVGGANPVLFAAFSTPNTFAPYNTNEVAFDFIGASSPGSAPVSAATKGFGAIFLNVQEAGTTITYFHGSSVLTTLKVPTNATAGAPVFAGEEFSAAIVTNVLITLGTGTIFSVSGTTVTSGNANSATNNLVAMDNWVFPEPVPIANGLSIPTAAPGTANAPVLATLAPLGRAFTGVVANFSDVNTTGVAGDFRATINWGDGTQSVATTIAVDATFGFTVSGTHTYTTVGTLPVSVTVVDLGGSTVTVTNAITVLSANQTFVQALYHDFLGRSGTVTELNGWVNDLPGIGLAGVAHDISHSTEALTDAVGGFYEKYLGRAAAGTEDQVYITQLEDGSTYEVVIAEILASSEFANDANKVAGASSNSNINYVEDLYALLLDRAGSAAEINGWVNELSGLGRVGVALQFLESAEDRVDQVTLLYTTLLHRTTAPSAAEVAGWVNGGLGLLAIETAFASSPEYFQDG